MKTAGDMAFETLLTSPRSLHTTEIVEAMRSRGWEFQVPYPVVSLAASLSKDDRFYEKRNGPTRDVSEWFLRNRSTATREKFR